MDDSKPTSNKKTYMKPGRPGVSPSPASSVPDLPRISIPPTEKPSLPKKPKNKKRIWLIVSIAFALLVVGAAAGGWWWYTMSLQPVSQTKSHIKITVVTGETVEAIAKKLEEKKVIRSAYAFQLYVSERGAKDKLQAGSYVFSPSQTPKEIVDWLVEGKVDTYNLTILPGQTLADIKEKLQKDGFDGAAVDAAYARQYDHPLLHDKPAEANLEGYVYPETYQMSSDTTVEQLLIRTFDEFEKQIEAKQLRPALQAKGLNLHQAITLGSLVQMEVSNPTDRRQVAQVFEKRLQDGMELGSDVTFFYAAKLLGITPSVTIDSPYNTRLYKGLPPGAIANFDISALEAVANPAAGDYLYFVAGDDGKTYFARTEEEHTANVKKYCTKLCHSAE